MESKPSENRDKKTSPLQVIGSVLAAAFGVQSSKNRERDFKHGKARNYIVAGIIFTLVFMLVVFSVVRLVLQQAGN